MIQTLGQLDTVTESTMSHEGCTHFSFIHRAHYFKDTRPLRLHVLLLVEQGRIHAIITPRDITAAVQESSSSAAECFDRTALESASQAIDLTEPLSLSPVEIPKPWGKEIWYTGIEERGVSKINETPIAWVLDVFGAALGFPNPPMLLKILAPSPEKNLGDLYFEMHEKKTEVYVVTAVDPSAWPSGTGKIRYGFNADKLKTYKNESDFFNDYLVAVGLYREVRNEIDHHLDAASALSGLTQPLSRAEQEKLLTGLPETLKIEEQSLRDSMYAFTSLRDLAVGDIVKVPPLLPHSLQHGVRVIEFQTPHYERYILSFGQKVLTQNHWDTETVANRVQIAPADITPPQEIETGMDLAADFDEFKVLRLRLSPGDKKTIRHFAYSVCIGIEG
ncbi:MAG: hypothetical protein ACI8Z1_003693, partial [Candidatus Azotimanducaceae bacterium]